MITPLLSRQLPEHLLGRLVEVRGLAEAMGWVGPEEQKRFRRQLFRNTQGNRKSRIRQPFEEVADLAAEYVQYALEQMTSRTDFDDDELAAAIAASIASATDTPAANQRQVALQAVDQLARDHAHRLASKPWRLAHAMRAILACLEDGDGSDEIDPRWIETVCVAETEWSKSLEYYKERYALFLTLLPAMKPRKGAESIEAFARAAAWLTDGYGARVAVEEIASDQSVTPQDGGRLHAAILSESLCGLVDVYFEFGDA